MEEQKAATALVPYDEKSFLPLQVLRESDVANHALVPYEEKPPLPLRILHENDAAKQLREYLRHNRPVYAAAAPVAVPVPQYYTRKIEKSAPF